MRLTRTKWILLKLAIKTLPIVTVLGGALFGYLEGHEAGHNIMATMRGIPVKQSIDGLPWHIVLQNTAIGAALGLTGGITLTCFGLVISDLMTVVDDPVSRMAKGAGSSGISGAGSMSGKTYYKRQDVEDHERSTQKVAEKYDDKRQKEEVEKKEILEIGTDGVRAKKLGKKVEKKVPTQKTPNQ